MKKLQTIIKQLKDLFFLKDEIIFSYLFGSVAKGCATKLSDLDIAIYLDKEKANAKGPFGYKAELITEIEEKLKREIDLVILNDIHSNLAFNILKDGKLIFCKSKNLRINFHYQTMKEYQDLNHLKKVQNYYLKKNINS